MSEEKVDFQWHPSGSVMLIYGLANAKRVGGVGILVRHKYVNTLKSANQVSDRILAAKLNSNPELTIVSAYAPTKNATEDTKDKFYQDIHDYVHSIPAHNLLIVAVDFNARVGLDSHGVIPRVIGRYAYYTTSNDNGERLVNACESLSLRPLQHRFPQPRRRQWTWTHTSGSNAQLDHIIIKAKWINSARNCRSYSSVELDSHHRITVAWIEVSLRCSKIKSNNGRRLDWESIRENSTLQKKYAVAAENQFTIFYDAAEDASAQDDNDQFEKCLRKVSEATLMASRREKNQWVTCHTEDVRILREKAKVRSKV